MQPPADLNTRLNRARKLLLATSGALLTGVLLTATVIDSPTAADTPLEADGEQPVTPQPRVETPGAPPLETATAVEAETTPEVAAEIASEAILTVRVHGDRADPADLAALPGVTLRLHTGDAAGPQQALEPAWATCTSDAAGECVFTIPETQPATLISPAGAHYDARFWVIPTSVPAGWQPQPGPPGATPHTPPSFRTGEQLRAGEHYESEVDFFTDSISLTLDHTAQPYGGSPARATDWGFEVTLDGVTTQLTTDGAGHIAQDFEFTGHTPVELTVSPRLTTAQHEAGWTRPAVECNRNGKRITSATSDGGKVRLSVTPGDRVTCTAQTIQTRTPGISITKTAEPPVQHSTRAGAAVTWTYTVTNTGQTPLYDVVVDDKLTSTTISCPTDTLAAGDSMTCTAAGTVTAHH